MGRINVTKTFLPPIEEYEEYLKEIWNSDQLTNQGPLLQKFEQETKDYLGVDNLQLVSNGTVALQIALSALGIKSGEIITTPFSYVATTSAILWERCTPVYVDIEPDTFCIDVTKIEAAITPETKAILAVHVFGNPCDVDAIEAIARKHNLKVIYDGAHAFGVRYKGKALLNYGDVSICSFHSTKPFHTIEGGAVIAHDDELNQKVELIKRFGHQGDDHQMLGINGKASEFQAAMGLCNLKYIDEIIKKRKLLADTYNNALKETSHLSIPIYDKRERPNYAYYPIVFASESALKKAVAELESENIYPRRYFFPSLNTLTYVETSQSCSTSEDISKRILCLPLYDSLEESIINKICEVINHEEEN